MRRCEIFEDDEVFFGAAPRGPLHPEILTELIGEVEDNGWKFAVTRPVVPLLADNLHVYANIVSERIRDAIATKKDFRWRVATVTLILRGPPHRTWTGALVLNSADAAQWGGSARARLRCEGLAWTVPTSHAPINTAATVSRVALSAPITSESGEEDAAAPPFCLFPALFVAPPPFAPLAPPSFEGARTTRQAVEACAPPYAWEAWCTMIRTARTGDINTHTRPAAFLAQEYCGRVQRQLEVRMRCGRGDTTAAILKEIWRAPAAIVRLEFGERATCCLCDSLKEVTFALETCNGHVGLMGGTCMRRLRVAVFCVALVRYVFWFARAFTGYADSLFVLCEQALKHNCDDDDRYLD